VLLPPALPPGLVGRWSFDDSMPLDSSGHGAHGLATVAAGPAFASQGGSASFHRHFLLIPGADQLTLRDFSYSFWAFLVEHRVQHATSRLCPLLRKGLDNSARARRGGAFHASAPAILYNTQTGRLHVEISTATDTVSSSAEGFESNARIRRGRWFHIALVRVDGQRKTRLYVNGVLDVSKMTEGFTVANREPLYLGGDPSTKDLCDTPMYIDELKVYNRPLEPDEIEAEAAPALAGIEPSFVRFACADCTLEDAVDRCPDAYHICTSRELHMGGYQVAKTLGWLNPSSHVWSRAAAASSPQTSNAVAQQERLATLAPTEHMQPSSAANSTTSSAEQPMLPQLGLGICCADD